MWLIELKAFNQDSLAEETIYLSDIGYTSGTAAVDLGVGYTVPANTYYAGLLMEDLRVTRQLYSGNTIGGSSVPSFGDLRFTNADGEFDYLRRYTFDGRSIRVVRVEPDLSSPVLVFDGIIRDALVSEKDFIVRLLDEQSALAEKLAPLTLPYDRAYRFNATTNRAVECPAAASQASRFSWTIEFWCMPSQASEGVAFQMGDESAVGSAAKMFFRPSRGVRSGNWELQWAGLGYSGLAGSKTSQCYADGEPHHFAIVYNGTTITVYVDAELSRTFTPSGTISGGTQSVILGSAKTSSLLGPAINALMWDVRGWNYARTADEIERDREARLTGVEEGLHFWYPLDEAPEDVEQKQVFDYGPNGYHGTIAGAAQKPYVAGFGSAQLEGRQQPRAVGRVFNAQPDLLDPRAQLYRASSDPCGSLAVKYGGEVMRGQVAANYNGTTSYSTIAAPGAAWDSPTTWEISFNADTLSGTRRIFHWANGTATVALLTVGATLYLNAVDSAGTFYQIAAPSTLSVLTNYRVSAVLGSGYTALYLNGELQGTKSGFGGNFNVGTATIYLGRNAGSGIEFWDGRLWDFRIHDGDYPTIDREEWFEQLYHEPATMPLGWWRLDDNDTTVRDWSPNGNTGTHTNPLWSDAEWEDLLDGRFRVNGSVERPLTCDYRYWNPLGRGTQNRQQGYAYWAHSTDYEPGAGDFTWECWIRPDQDITATGANQFPISKKNEGSTATTAGSWHLRMSTSDFMQFYLTDGSATVATATLSQLYYRPSARAGLWDHVAAVWDASARTIQWYVNGEAANTSDMSTLSAGYNYTAPTEVLSLFDRDGAGVNPFVGALAEVRFWKEARTAQQVRDNYLRRGTDLMARGEAANLSFYWRGDESLGTTGYSGAGASYNRAPSSSAGAAATVGNAGSFRVCPGPYFDTPVEAVRVLVGEQMSLTDDIESFDAYESRVGGWFFDGGTVRDALDELLRPNGYWTFYEKLAIGTMRAPDVRHYLQGTPGSQPGAAVAEYADIETHENRTFECMLRVLGSIGAGQQLWRADHFDVTYNTTGVIGVSWYLNDGPGTWYSCFFDYADTPLGDGMWHRLTVRPSASDNWADLFIDGVEIARSGTFSPTSGTGITRTYNGLWLAGPHTTTNTTPIANFCDFRIWKRTLTDDEIARYVNVELPEDASNFAGYWKMDEGEGTVITDYSSNAQNATIGGLHVWQVGSLYDNPVYRVPDKTYSNSDEVSIQRIGSILPVTEQRVRYLKNFSRVPRDQTLPSTYENPELVRLLDSDGPKATQVSAIAAERHLRPDADSSVVEAPYRFLDDASVAARIRVANFGAQRERYRVVVYDEDFVPCVGQEIRLKDTRFNFPEEGKNFVSIGVQEDYKNNTFILDLWG